MPDQYRIADETHVVEDQSEKERTGGSLRPLLWLVLIVSAAANTVTSNLGINPLISSGFGVVTLASVVALIAHHYRTRRR